MINRLQLAPLLLALLLGAAPLLAQPETGEKSAAADDEPADKPAATQEAPAGDAAAGADTRSPFDYRSSEEISEDVPVSFPVDI
tara:strand:- start:497 stop:748 length:252 start_codon:yes stop_codon:yes gene_type:complete